MPTLPPLSDDDLLRSSASRIRSLVRALATSRALSTGDRILLDELRDEAVHLERLAALGVGR